MAQWVDLQYFWPQGFCFPFQTAQKRVTLIWLYRSSGKEKESRCLVFWPSTKRENRHFYVVVLRWRQRNVQKSAMHVNVVVKQIVFLRPQRGFPNIVLSKMNVHEHWTRVTRFNPLWVFWTTWCPKVNFTLSLFKICILIHLNTLKFERSGSLE